MRGRFEAYNTSGPLHRRICEGIADVDLETVSLHTSDDSSMSIRGRKAGWEYTLFPVIKGPGN